MTRSATLVPAAELRLKLVAHLKNCKDSPKNMHYGFHNIVAGRLWLVLKERYELENVVGDSSETEDDSPLTEERATVAVFVGVGPGDPRELAIVSGTLLRYYTTTMMYYDDRSFSPGQVSENVEEIADGDQVEVDYQPVILDNTTTHYHNTRQIDRHRAGPTWTLCSLAEK